MLTSRLVPQIARQMAVRNSSFCSGSVISGPPTKNVSFAEKVGCGLLMVASFLVIPSWVLVHMEDYKSRA